MQIINLPKLQKFQLKHANARKSLQTWKKIVDESNRAQARDVLQSFPTAKIISKKRARFEIKHNVYRLVAEIDYQDQLLTIRFIGTHNEYDEIDAKTI
jgi:mRNA interferase HigB